jgi:hypothetical protein
MPRLGIFEVARIDGYRLGPAEDHRRLHQDQHGRQQDGAEGIDVILGVQRQAALGLGRVVAQPPGHPAMGEFVEGQGHEQRQYFQQDQSDIHDQGFLRSLMQFMQRKGDD